MDIRTFTRATEPHRASLGDALFVVVGPHYGRYDKGTFYLEADFGGTTDAAVQAIVDAAPAASSALDAKLEADRMTLLEKAAYLTLLDAINLERQTSGRPVITPAQFVAAVKAKVDSLGG
jgi:hypothetical protein